MQYKPGLVHRVVQIAVQICLLWGCALGCVEGLCYFVSRRRLSWRLGSCGAPGGSPGASCSCGAPGAYWAAPSCKLLLRCSSAAEILDWVVQRVVYLVVRGVVLGCELVTSPPVCFRAYFGILSGLWARRSSGGRKQRNPKSAVGVARSAAGGARSAAGGARSAAGAASAGALGHVSQSESNLRPPKVL